MTSFKARSQAWLSQMKDSIIGLFIGIILVLACIVVLFWNEGRHVKNVKDLNDASERARTIQCKTFDASLVGELVFMTCPIDFGEGVKDRIGVEEKEAVWMKRSVELFQYKQKTRTDKKQGDDANAEKYYEEGWYAGYIDSKSFPNTYDNNKNFLSVLRPEKMKPGNWDGIDKIYQSKVRLGEYTLNRDEDGLVQQLKKTKTLTLNPAKVPYYDVQDPQNKTQRMDITGGNTLELKDRARVSYEVNKRTLYCCQIPTKTWLKVGSATAVTLVAEMTSQRGFSKQFRSSSGRPKTAMLLDGEMSKDEFFARQFESNSARTWVLRIFGFLLMWCGLAMFMGPLSVAPDIIPFVGPFIGSLVNGIIFIASLVAAVCISTTVICIAWVFYRPLFAIGIVLVGVIVALSIRHRRKQAGGTTTKGTVFV